MRGSSGSHKDIGKVEEPSPSTLREDSRPRARLDLQVPGEGERVAEGRIDDWSKRLVARLSGHVAVYICHVYPSGGEA